MTETLHKLDHPTPVHIRSCITQRLIDGVKAGMPAYPYWVTLAIENGIRDANKEHAGGK